jgi:hypothetical protein
MTVRSTMKSYAKIVFLGYDQNVSVDFKDTLGNTLPCNYFSVENRSDGATEGGGPQGDVGYYIVQPSGTHGTQTELYESTLSSIHAATMASGTGVGKQHSGSGTGGVIGTADGSVEMSLNSSEKATGIRIWNLLGNAIGVTSSKLGTFVITYGNMKQANPNRDQDDAYYPAGR